MRDKFLTEAMGECWHEWVNQRSHEAVACTKCDGLWGTDRTPDFSSWQGFGKLWEWAQGQEWWCDCYCGLLYSETNPEPENPIKFEVPDEWVMNMLIHQHLIHPDHFADAIYSFLTNKEHTHDNPNHPRTR